MLVGPDAKGLSASAAARLKRQWGKVYEVWLDATQADAENAIDTFIRTFEAKYRKVEERLLKHH